MKKLFCFLEQKVIEEAANDKKGAPLFVKADDELIPEQRLDAVADFGGHCAQSRGEKTMWLIGTLNTR